MAKLSKEQWAVARAKWERSKKEGFEWLTKELGVARPVISRRAKAENWTKKGTEKGTQDAKKGTQKSTATTKESNTNLTKKLATKEPSGKYKASYAEEAYRLCLMGATNEQLATAFDVCIATITNWQNEYFEFWDAIRRGKDYADAQMAESLFKLGMGLHATKEQCLDPDGNVLGETIKSVPASATALVFWLKNRQPELWKDKHNHEVSATLDKDALTNLSTVIAQRLEEARARNRAVLIERGIIIDSESI